MPIPDERRRALSESRRGDKNPMFGTVSPTRKFALTEAELRRLYVDEGHNKRWIAKHCGVSPSAISQWLRRYGIRLGEDEILRRQRTRAWNYRGHKITQRGYTYLVNPDHPAANRDGYVMAHRLVIEGEIGRLLTPGEQVHHINLTKSDNRLENLILFPSSAVHSAYHKYLERMCLGLLGLAEVPAPFTCGELLFVSGEWTEVLDLAPHAARATALKVPGDPAVVQRHRWVPPAAGA